MDRNGRPMTGQRPAASLTSSLLARRGDARPAMRRPPIQSHHEPASIDEDLGWNDLGDDADFHEGRPTSLAAMTPGPGAPDHHQAHEPHQNDTHQQPEANLSFEAAEATAEPHEPAAEPEVETQAEIEAQAELEVPTRAEASPVMERLEAIARRIAMSPREDKFKPMVARKADEPAREPGGRRKAAFTLRIEPDRHLRLRLLSAVTHRSAQQLLIEALDSLLTKHDTLEDIAGRVESEDEMDYREGGLKKQA